MHTVAPQIRWLTAACLVSLLALPAFADEMPLHARIDRLIETHDGQLPAEQLASDAEFLRRIYLDLAGRIPTVDEARRFLEDSSAEKRATLIDQLLDGSDYPRRMQELFHAMLMERRGDNDEWTKFLRAAFEQNMPWDQVARAILHPDADDETTRGAAYFFTARLVKEGAMAPLDVPGLTRDVGRLLAGVDLQCAQCHDHVSIDDYKQQDFQGLHVIFENVLTRRDVQFPAVSEKLLAGPQEYMSVFIQEPKTTGVVVPGGDEIAVPTFAKGEEYAVPPDRQKRTPGIPKFSPLTVLADGLASPDNQLFCRNITNRLWFVMMGHGLIEPLDLQHTSNPAQHPELLDLMASGFASHGFDVKWLFRELALSKTYQRSSAAAEGDALADDSYTLAHEKRLSAEQLFWSVLIATGELDRLKSDGASIEKLVDGSDELKDLRARFLDAFANPAKEPEIDFEPTVKAALFLMHDEQVLGLLERRDGNLIDRLAALDDGEVAEELFLAVLSRPPTDEDRTDVAEYLKANPQRERALGELAWALLASTEFCVNH